MFSSLINILHLSLSSCLFSWSISPVIIIRSLSLCQWLILVADSLESERFRKEKYPRTAPNSRTFWWKWALKYYVNWECKSNRKLCGWHWNKSAADVSVAWLVSKLQSRESRVCIPNPSDTPPLVFTKLYLTCGFGTNFRNHNFQIRHLFVLLLIKSKANNVSRALSLILSRTASGLFQGSLSASLKAEAEWD